MGKKVQLPIPVKATLRRLGKNISDARRRRRITMELMAERAAISRITLSKIEKGDPGVSMGGYASVIFSLGMVEHLSKLVDASSDIVGRELEEENLPERVRHPSKNKNSIDE